MTAHDARAAGIPTVIRRNTALIALALSFTGAGMGLAYGLGPLMVVKLTDSAALSGLSVGLIGLSRFMVSYPIGRITDHHGRKPGILLGLVLALAGTLGIGAAMNTASIALFVIGFLVFGMGMNAAQQLRVAATDMYPVRMRAEALGFVALGALVGLVVTPILVTTAEHVAGRVGADALALPWYFVPILIVPCMLTVRLIRPDPKEIGMTLDRYYPEARPAPPPANGPTGFQASRLLAFAPTRLAIVSNCAATGNMTIVMVLTSLVLAHHGHSVSEIAFSHMFHTAGMFAFTIPLGRLADRVGRAKVMFPGVAITLGGAALVSFTHGYWLVTLGTFLVGLGLKAHHVGVLGDRAHPAR